MEQIVSVLAMTSFVYVHQAFVVQHVPSVSSLQEKIFNPQSLIFLTTATRLWKQFPALVKSSVSLTQSNKKLKTHLLSKWFDLLPFYVFLVIAFVLYFSTTCSRFLFSLGLDEFLWRPYHAISRINYYYYCYYYYYPEAFHSISVQTFFPFVMIRSF